MKTIIAVIFIAVLLGSNLAVAESIPSEVLFLLPDHTIISNAAVARHVRPQDLLAVARCESSMNPKATNGASFGILQFIPSTFERYSKILDISNPDIWSVSQQSEMAAYMFSVGQEGQWTCARLVGLVK